MVKVILNLFPVLHAESPEERIAMRPLGRNADRYHEALHGWTDIIKAADEMGVWGASTIEHHFHSEGYEVSPSPGILNAYWAAITKNIRVGQLGYVMSTQNPFRVAEETAIIDHLTSGRTFVGFARGYQDRWTNIIGQHLGAVATHSDGSADDKKNRAIFEEQVDMVIQAWTQDSIDHNTDLWKVPNPYDEGIDWWMSGTTERMGAPGEIGPDGNVHRVSVVPSPYTKPHPPVFVASLGTGASVAYCARNGFVPVYFGSREKTVEAGPAYVKVAKEHGRDYDLGQNMCVVHNIQIADTYPELRQALADYDSDVYMNFINPLYKVLDPQFALDDNASIDEIVDRLESIDMFLTGTRETAKAQFIKEWEELPAEYVCLIMHYAQQPKESVIKNLEIFMTEIKPELDKLTPWDDD